MYIYKMIKTIKKDVFIGYDDVDIVHWSLTLGNDAKIVNSIEKCENYDELYAIKYTIDKMNVEELLTVMYEELSVEEVKQICDADPTVSQCFMAFLGGENIRKQLKEIAENAKDAKDSASVASAVSVLSLLN